MNRSLKTPGDCQRPCSFLDHFLRCLMLGLYLITLHSACPTANKLTMSPVSNFFFLFFSFWMIPKIKRQMQSWAMLNWSVHFGRSDSDQSDVLLMMGGKKNGRTKQNKWSHEDLFFCLVDSKTLVRERQKLPFYCITTWTDPQCWDDSRDLSFSRLFCF